MRKKLQKNHSDAIEIRGRVCRPETSGGKIAA
jgi:hypothetical protein